MEFYFCLTLCTRKSKGLLNLSSDPECSKNNTKIRYIATVAFKTFIKQNVGFLKTNRIYKAPNKVK